MFRRKILKCSFSKTLRNYDYLKSAVFKTFLLGKFMNSKIIKPDYKTVVTKSIEFYRLHLTTTQVKLT